MAAPLAILLKSPHLLVKGILSPIIYTIYCTDLEDWVKHSKITNYADDTSSGCKGKTETEVKRKLEEDAKNILKYVHDAHTYYKSTIAT